MYYLYLHTMPDGKIYIGHTRQELDKRWSCGDGYILNAKFYNAIKNVGWENIKHEVLGVFETQEEVDLYEKLFIVYFNSEDSNIGYNRTSFVSRLKQKYNSRYEIYDRPKTDTKQLGTGLSKNPFEENDIPISQAKIIIDNWIYNKFYREVFKDKMLDGITYEEMAKKYGYSVQALKKIVYECKEIIRAHI